MTIPVLLDAFCGAGGATRGYQRAGFRVVGVDIEPQPNYCGDDFVQGDAIAFIEKYGARFDGIHSSPPCRAYTKEAGQHGTRKNHPDLIVPTRKVLLSTTRPYVIENILEARRHLIDPVMLCGVMFDLGVFRHRLFEMPWWTQERVPHERHAGRIGDGRFVTVTGQTGGYSVRDKIQHGCKADWERAMDIDWMTSNQLAQAIPPAYAEYVGSHLMVALQERAA